MENRSWLLASYHIQDFGVKGLSQIALPEKKMWQILNEKRNLPEVDALFYIQTCNRIEYLYCLKHQDIHNIDMNQYLPALTSRIHTDLGEITEHLLSVCLSKDSLVFGENQILGQFKRSYRDAIDNGFLNKDLNNLLQWVLKEAKSIRGSLPFKHFPNSISALAAKKIQSLHTSDAKILLVGAGETNEIVAKHLAKKSYQNITCINRTDEKANVLAEAVKGKSHSWEKRGNLKDFDVVVCATASKEILVHFEELKNLKPKTAIDLSVPINIHAGSCHDLHIDYYDVASFRKNLSDVKEQSEKFLWDLQKSIIEAKNKIMGQWNVFTNASLFKSFKEHQKQSIDSILNELKQSQMETESLARVEKQLKKLCHEQILDLRSRVKENEVY